MNKSVLTIFITIFILVVNIAILHLNKPTKSSDIQQKQAYSASVVKNKEKENNLKKPEKPKIRIYMVGDIMLDRGVAYRIENQGQGDFRFPFLNIAEELQKADILFGNLEGPISDKGNKVGSIYSFRAKPEAIQGLVYAGFDILSLANNHIFDYQRTALEQTMDILGENNIDYIGAGFNAKQAFSNKIKEVRGVKIGFLAYTNLGANGWQAKENTPGIAFIDQSNIEQIKKDINDAKKQADILIVSLHSGREYSESQTYFQTFFAREAVNSGADLVIGHHPHVVQKIEKYQQAWIAYSLGNFIFDQSFSTSTMESVLLEAIIEDKKIKQVIPKSIKLNYLFQPFLQVF